MVNERVVSRVEDSRPFASKIEIYFQPSPIFVARFSFFSVLRIRIRDWVLFDPWIRDPGWEKVSIRIRDPG